MNCDELHLRLDAYLEHVLGCEEVRGLEAHLQGCAECRSVVGLLARGESAHPSFVLDVVARTTGRTCGRVRDALAQEDGLSDGDCAAHLEECSACRDVAASLQWVRARLPRLAAIEVDADFTADVLMVTLPRPSLVHVFALRMRERVGRWVGDWLERPLAALELAFALTLVLVLLTATPWSPLPWLPQRALDVLLIVSEVRAGELLAGELQAGEEPWTLVQALLPLRYAAEAGNELREAMTPRVDRMARDLEWVGAGLGAAGQGVVSGEGILVRHGLHTLGCGLTSFWVGLRMPAAQVEDDCAGTRPRGRGDADQQPGGEGDGR